MDDRQLIEDLLSVLEYHTEQTRPIEFSKVAIEAAREYLQKPTQQEPVAWEQFYPDIGKPQIAEALAKEKALQALHDENERLCLYKDAYAEQEPMAWISTGTARMIHWTADKPAYGDDWVPLYTTPPQRKPQYDKTKMNCFVQDLYDKKMQEGKHGQYEAMFHVVHRAIEAAHDIKE